MKKIIHPVVFNIITIAALLLALVQVITTPARTTMTTTSEVVQILVEHAPQSAAVDEALSLRMAADQAWRLRFDNTMISAAVIAILANIVANHLGRRRQRTNQNRISHLEDKLRGLKTRSS